MTISIVIPTYNGSRFIEQAILSALNQERPADEIIVCDDNSSDDTLEICMRYKHRISIYVNSDGPSGFVNAWNKAIERAKGDYISILHQDDLLEPAFIRKGLAAIERHPEVLHMFSTCRYIDENGATISFSADEGMGSGEVWMTGQAYVRYYQGVGEPHIHRCPGVITHRSIFEQCRYEPRAGHIADDDFFYRVGMFTDVVGILDPLACFRIHDRSVTGAMDDARLVGSLMDDYIYQCRQWKGHPFIDAEAYDYFVQHAKKYIRRYIGYGLQRGRIGMILKGMRRWGRLFQELYLSQGRDRVIGNL